QQPLAHGGRVAVDRALLRVFEVLTLRRGVIPRHRLLRWRDARLGRAPPHEPPAPAAPRQVLRLLRRWRAGDGHANAGPRLLQQRPRLETVAVDLHHLRSGERVDEPREAERPAEL